MPSQMKTKGNTRGKSDARMAVIKWARQNGAVHIKVDGIELTFLSDVSEGGPRVALSPEDIAQRVAQGPESDNQASDAVRSQHPDEFADQSDRWQHFRPITVRG